MRRGEWTARTTKTSIVRMRSRRAITRSLLVRGSCAWYVYYVYRLVHSSITEGLVQGAKNTTRRKKGKRHVAQEVDLNEDSDAQSEGPRSVSENEDTCGDEDEDEEMDEETSGEFFDVLDIFDGRADLEEGDDPPLKVDKKFQDIKTKDAAVEDEEEWRGAEDPDIGMSGDEHGSQDGYEDQEDDEEEEDSTVEDDELRISASDSEDPSPEALADLETFLSNLDPPKRKPDDVVEPGSRKRRRVIDRTEAGEESEFGVRGKHSSIVHV